MALIDTIQQSDLLGLDDSATLAALNTTTTLYEDHVLHQWTFVYQSLINQGIAPSVVFASERLLTAVGDAGVALVSSIAAGIDFADPLTIAQINSFIGSVDTETATILNGLLAIGKPRGYRWQIASNGINTQPVLSDITEARQLIVNYRQQNYLQQQFLNAALNAGAGKTAIQAIVADDSKWGS